MSESTVPVIPLDIIENIVDTLINDAEGLQYVKAFSLTCQSFLPFCRKHILSSITIKTVSTRPSIKHPTVEAFFETPAIAKYVRQLTISITQQPYSDYEYSFDQVVRQLTRLQSLTISLSYQPDYRATSNDWNTLSSSMKRLLLNLMHLPTLTHLGLDATKNFPISNLIACANLKHLSLQNSCISYKHDEAVSSLLHKPIQLQSLHVEIRGSEMPALLAARFPDGRLVIDLTDLEKITIDFHDDWRNTAVLTREIFKRAQRLRDISLDVNDIDFRAMELANMVTPSLQTLRRIELRVLIDSYSQDPLAVVCDKLEHISGKNKLESVELQIELQTDGDCSTGAEWGRLEKVLQSGWPMLNHISLVIVITSYSELRIDGPFGMALKSLPQSQFTGFMSNKNLDFQFSVQEKWI